MHLLFDVAYPEPLFTNSSDILLWGVLGGIVLVGIIVFFVVRAVRKKK